MGKFNTIAKSYKNFNELKWRAEESQNISKIMDFILECEIESNLPDTTKAFLERVNKRLENEQAKVDRNITELWQKEEEAIAKRNRKIKRNQKKKHEQANTN